MCGLVAQVMQTQASPRLAGAICASNEGSKATPVHQQGGCFWPVSFSSSMAQRLGWLHSGHWAGAASSGGLLSCRFMATAIVLQLVAAQNERGSNHHEGDVHPAPGPGGTATRAMRSATSWKAKASCWRLRRLDPAALSGARAAPDLRQLQRGIQLGSSHRSCCLQCCLYCAPPPQSHKNAAVPHGQKSAR